MARTPYAGLWEHAAVLKDAPRLRELDDPYWSPLEMAGLWASTLSGLEQLHAAGWPKYSSSETLGHHLADFEAQLQSMRKGMGAWVDDMRNLRAKARVLVEGIAK
ncbi:hypothetical protein TSOC_000557, partial [Tetrabaena socialis]